VLLQHIGLTLNTFWFNHFNMRGLFLFVLSLLSAGHALMAQENFSDNIRLNQIGFYPQAEKIAVILDEAATDFYITSPDRKKKYFSGTLSTIKESSYSPKKTRIADFSALTVPGTFVLVVPGLGYSYPFEIKQKVHEELTRASLKSFYFQRFSLPLTEPYAGKWKRPSSGSHTKILIHPSAATEKRPEGTVISSPRGWIDAGDYNKYVVNSGITTATLLSSYEDFPEYYDTLQLNIPESNNAIPDIIDETLWNVRWVLTMQDPDDGGVYHKCTNAKFDGMVMPDQATTPRYMVQKGTGAALNFAAVLAQTSRVVRKFEQYLPGLADSCLLASQKAWTWAKQNPEVIYDQNKMNAAFDPDVSTGGYGDKNFSDEFLWAAAELLTTSGDGKYGLDINWFPDNEMPVPTWNQVRLLGYYSLMRHETKLPSGLQDTVSEIKKRMQQKADVMIHDAGMHIYRIVMGCSPKDFVWGSNSVAANQSILLINTYRFTGDKKYMDKALSNLDYLLGRNATGYSFVTGHGDKTPMHIHHRPSEADGIVEPVPGLLAGGPNPGRQDKCQYPSSVPDEAYVDDVCSYASNEVAINWNAPLVYLTGAMEALQFKVQYSKK
jgi:endoglucanase